MLHALRHHKHIARCQLHRRHCASRISKLDLKGAIEDKEELVGVAMRMPNVLAKGVSNPHVVVVHRGHDARAIHVIERSQSLVQVHWLVCGHQPILTTVSAAVLYVVDIGMVDIDMVDTDVAGIDSEIPGGPGCRIKAWRPAGVDGISEVFHARIVDFSYPSHCHDTWTVLIVDTGAISYDLDRRQCGAIGETISILPPGVAHNGKPAPGAKGFAKRVLYLEQSVLPLELVGAAVDRTNITDPELRRSLAALHDEFAVGADPFLASSALALTAERITHHLTDRRFVAPTADLGVAQQLRLLLDEPASEQITLDAAARQLCRSKAHLIRSFTARYGIAPHGYLIGRRVEAARKLLLNGVRPAEAAVAVGFYDQSHFTRHFKRHTAVSPAAYAGSRNAPIVD